MAHASLLNGRELAAIVQEQLRSQINDLITDCNIRSPKLVVILVGDNAASMTYVKAKQRMGDQVGIVVEVMHLEAHVSADQFKNIVHQINQDSNSDAVIVQLPLPAHLNTQEILSWLEPKKDVDSLTPVNISKLVLGDPSGFIPCTPKGILKLLDHYTIDLRGKKVTIIGRSLIVGRPLSILLSHPAWKGQSTVTLAHSHTLNLVECCQSADIIISAAGAANLIGNDHVKEKAVVIDVGIHRLASGKLCGDVDFNAVLSKVSAITPVPGGVGPMTVAMLLENCVLAWKRGFNIKLSEDKEVL